MLRKSSKYESKKAKQFLPLGKRNSLTVHYTFPQIFTQQVK